LHNLTVVIPFFQGHETLRQLLETLPATLPVVIVDDQSSPPLQRQSWMRSNHTVLRLEEKGYFAGAVNAGIDFCKTDVLILNQDTSFYDDGWLALIENNRRRYALIGERIHGTHPSFGDLGYAHGTFLFLRRDALERAGALNRQDYPLWGGTAELQWRFARRGFDILPLEKIPGFSHQRPVSQAFGSSIKKLLNQKPELESLLIRTPPLLSVIVPCYNYGRYLSDCVNSLIGGWTVLGEMPGQTLQSFEIVIVDDASTDDSWQYAQEVADLRKGIRAYQLEKNGGTAKALNYGIARAYGKYITFLSADDMREPDSLEALVRRLEQKPHSFAYDDICLFNKHKRIKEWKMEDYDFETLLYKNQVHAGIVFPKTAWHEVGGYPEIMNDGREDWAMNVALGIHGYCGEHVRKFGYLYRRENQNRSLTNTSPEHHRRFLRKIESVFPRIYGGYRPMACCGKKSSPSKSSPAVQSMQSMARKSTVNMMSAGGNLMAASTGSQGMVRLQYNGKQMTAVWDGPITNTRYRFGVDRPTGWVDKRDAGEKGGKGFLSLKDTKGGFLFELVGEETASQVTQSSSPQQVTVVTSEAKAAPSEMVVVELVEEEPTTAEETSFYPVSSTVDPSEYNIAEIQAMNLDPAGWQAVYKAEMAADRPRKSLLTWLEEKLAGG